ncbi:hypothetical protein SAMD00019534_081490, partial [Acytostelium subglobosum LB1]|uniref:hypothetical protein n=1 Tax=Acytostelium subglobosum LB1 TaxID=1410327 RepID=UPI000644E407
YCQPYQPICQVINMTQRNPFIINSGNDPKSNDTYIVENTLMFNSHSIPSNTKSLIFGGLINEYITPGLLPDTLKSILFGTSFNQPIDHGCLPSSLTSLSFGDHFDQPLEPRVLPPSLKSLTFGNLYDHTFKKNTLPSTLTQLSLGIYYLKPINPGILPSSITSLVLGQGYNQPLSPDVLPMSLTELTIGEHFKQLANVDMVSFPANLQRLNIHNVTQLCYLTCKPHSIEHLIVQRPYVEPRNFDPIQPTQGLKILEITTNIRLFTSYIRFMELYSYFHHKFPGVQTIHLYVDGNSYYKETVFKFRLMDRLPRQPAQVLFTLRHTHKSGPTLFDHIPTSPDLDDESLKPKTI